MNTPPAAPSPPAIARHGFRHGFRHGTRCTLPGCGVSLAFAALVAASVPVFLPSLRAAPGDAGTPPNILLLYADDLGWGDAGFLGSDFYETPHLDALAAESVVFPHGYAPAANCAPSRASLLTGCYSPRHEFYNVGTGPRGKAAQRRLVHVPGTDTLSPDAPTWPRLLSERGWRLGHFGKWHLGVDPESGPLAHGFHRNVGGDRSGSPPNYFAPFRQGVPGLGGEDDGRHIAEVLAEAAAAFVAEGAQRPHRPWLAYVPFFDVHTPIRARADLVARYESKPPGERHHHAVYAAMVHTLDDAVGRILAALEESGQAVNTLVVFTSDNGGYGPVTSMAPLRGYKGTYYEGGIRVPFLVRWPGVAEPGVCGTPVHQIDLHATFCEIAGTAPPPDANPDGRSLATLLREGRDAALDERALFWHFPAYLESYSRTDGQRDPHFRSRPVSVVRRGDWKLLLHHEEWLLDGGREGLPDNGAVELYHLVSDPGESRDLAAEEPERLDALLDELLAWIAETGAPFASEPDRE